jgi:hypothetical protein
MKAKLNPTLLIGVAIGFFVVPKIIKAVRR